VDHATSTNSSILKLSGCPLYAPWFDGSRWGFELVAGPPRPTNCVSAGRKNGHVNSMT
jgi:hypothetical protein